MKRMKKVSTAACSAVFLAGLAIWPACSSREKAAEKMAENILEKASGGKVDVDIKGGSVNVATKEGTVSWGEASGWPEDMPAGIPRFTEGKVTGVIRTHGAESKNWSLVLGEVKEGALSNYAEVLKGEGWEILTLSQSAGYEALTARKDRTTLTLSYYGADKTGTFNVALSLE